MYAEFSINGWGMRAHYGNGVIGIDRSIFGSWHPQGHVTIDEFKQSYGDEIADKVFAQLGVSQ